MPEEGHLTVKIKLPAFQPDLRGELQPLMTYGFELIDRLKHLDIRLFFVIVDTPEVSMLTLGVEPPVPLEGQGSWRMGMGLSLFKSRDQHPHVLVSDPLVRVSG